MAELTGSTYYTNQVGSNGDSKVKTYPAAQNFRLIRIRRDLDGTESANDTFDVLKLKEGQVVIPGMSYVTSDDAGTTLTMDIGDASDADRYADGINLAAAAGKVDFCSSAIPAGEDTPHAATSATADVIATIATSGTPSAASLVFYIAVADASYSEE